MNLQDIQNEVVLLTKEPLPSNPIFATLANVTTFANEGQKKVARRTRNRIKTNFPNLNGGAWSANQYQTIMPTTTQPASGNFSLTFNAQQTGNLPWNATARQIEQALQALSTIGQNNCFVWGNWLVGYTFVFSSTFSGITIGMITISAGLFDASGNAVAFTITGVLAGNQDAAYYTVPNVRLYPLPHDFLQMEGMSINNYAMTPARFGDFNKNVMWHRLPGWSLKYYYERDQFSNSYLLGLFMRPTNSWPIGMTYIPKPVDMVATTDLPDIEDFLHVSLVHYSCQRVMESRREYEKAQYWAGQFEKDLQDYESSGQDTDEAIPMYSGPRPSD
jgi:hypothetical protein